MKIPRSRWAIITCLVMILVSANSGHAAERVEVRTLQSWNLPHPFEGPKNLTEDIFAFLMHPTVKEYAKSKTLKIEYSKEDDCLLLYGPKNETNQVIEIISQMNSYGHHYSRILKHTLTQRNDHTQVIKFPNVCSVSGGSNLVRQEFEHLPVLTEVWRRGVRYGMKKGTYPTLGDFQFPITAHTKGKGIEGDLRFLSNHTSHGEVHVLSYRGESKEILSDRLTKGTEARIFLDVPYKQLLRNTPEKANEWALYRAGSKALKLMCPNYSSPRVKYLFQSKSYRRMVQDVADLVYHGDAVGIRDTGLQPVHKRNALAFHSWRKFSPQKRQSEEVQLSNRWQVWLRKLSKAPQTFGGHFSAVAGNDSAGNALRFTDSETSKLPKLRVFFSDNINDQPYFINLQEQLRELGILDLEVNMGSDFIAADHFRRILQHDQSLEKGHEAVVFDIPVPHNDHVEHYFSRAGNFFGLDEGIAPHTLKQVDQIETGDWTPGATQRLGQLLRQEIPCIIVGQHPFYVYVRKEGGYRLHAGSNTANWRQATTAFRLGKRIAISAQQ